MSALLTPAEARQSICPFIRVCLNEAEVLQRNAQPIYSHQCCMGPDCKIGWRWTSTLTVNNPNRQFTAEGHQAGQGIKRTHGYCGAFGRAE